MKTSRLIGAWALAFSLAFALSASADVAATLERIYAEQDVQTEMPETPPGEPRQPASIPAAQPLAGTVGVTLFVACVVALLLALAVTTDWAPLRRRLSGLPKRSAEATDATAERLPDWFPQADDLAAEGRYAEAVHALLLGVLSMPRSGERRWPAAATGREIARHLRSDDLRQLVAAAELAHFRGQPASMDDFHRCRTRAIRIRESAVSAGSTSVAPNP